MGLHYMHDGEFWIEFFTDFCREFEVSVIPPSCSIFTSQIFLVQEVSICTLGPDFDQDGHVDGAKFMRIVYGEWQADSTAGGCRNDLKLFATNPQFLLTIHPVRNDKFGVLQTSNI